MSAMEMRRNLIVDLLLSEDDFSSDAKKRWWTPTSLGEYLHNCGVDGTLDVPDVGRVLVFMAKNNLALRQRYSGRCYYNLCVDNPPALSTQSQKHGIPSVPISVGRLDGLRQTVATIDQTGSVPVESSYPMGKMDKDGLPLGGRGRERCFTGTPDLPLGYCEKTGNSYQIVDNYLRLHFNKLLFNHHRSCTATVAGELRCEGVYKLGWASKEKYSCTGCGEKFEFTTCKEIKSTVVAEGKKFGRPQPVLNLSVPLALKLSGVNTHQAQELFGEAGLQQPTERNFRQSFGKVLVAIEERAHEILKENRRQLVSMIRESPTYDPKEDSITWQDSVTGVTHNTVMIMGSLDGAGSTRSYNHRITGTQGAVTAFGRYGDLTLPIGYKVDRTACWKCTLALHRAIRRGDEYPALSLGDHSGDCGSNSTHGPAVSEEFALEDIGGRLLLDEDNAYLGNDQALFMCFPITDGDTKGAFRLMVRQTEIIGRPSEGESERLPCSSHVSKNLGGALHKLKEADRTMRGVGLLENTRIKAIQSYIHTHLRRLKEKSWDLGTKPTETQVFLTVESIMNVIPHMCGVHSACKCEDLCGYLRLKNDNPVLKSKTVLTAEEDADLKVQSYAEKAKLSYDLGLNKVGADKVQKEISFRYNQLSVHHLSRLVTCNENESLWSNLTKYSQGKRLNQNYSKSWESNLHVTAGKKSRPDSYEEEVNSKIGTPTEMAPQVSFRVRRRAQRKQGTTRHGTSKYKQSRRNAKVVKSFMGSKKQLDNGKAHKTEKIGSSDLERVPIKGNRKSGGDGGRCSNCNRPGHNRKGCSYPILSRVDYCTEEYWARHSAIEY